MLPEIATLLARAETGRFMLDELLSVLDEKDYDSRPFEGEWSVREAVAHVASADLAVAQLVSEEQGDLGAALSDREHRWLALRALAVPELHRAVQQARKSVHRAMAALAFERLGGAVLLPASDAWGRQRAMDLRSYLASWAMHDLEHVEQIRDALRAPLNPALVALSASLRQ